MFRVPLAESSESGRALGTAMPWKTLGCFGMAIYQRGSQWFLGEAW